MSVQTRPEETEPSERLRARLAQELREKLLNKAVSLPLGSQPALVRVAYLCDLRGASIASIARAATADPSFSATLLRIANSAASASRFPISDLPKAITRLGTRMVGSLAVAAPTLRLLTAPDDDLTGVRREIHRHAIRVGVVARELSPQSIHPETALAAGLVHNVGLGVLSIYAPIGLRRVLDRAEPGVPFARVEDEVFGFTHAELGGLLATEWRYPSFLVDAIREHDSEAPATPLAALVEAADLFVRETGIGVEPPLPLQPSVARMARLITENARERAHAVLRAAADGEGSTGPTDVASAGQLIRTFDDLDLVA